MDYIPQEVDRFMLKRKSMTDCIFNTIAYVVVGLFAFACIIPFIYVIMYSVTPYTDYIQNPMNIIPRDITWDSYKSLLGFNLIYSGYKNTLIIVVCGTLLHLILTLITAYPLTKKGLKGQKTILMFIIFTMFFSGGMIPNFYLMRSLKLLNSLWALILPGIISVYNLLLLKGFIQELPESLEEAAAIEGANDIVILFKIVAPLILPAMVTIGLFYAVGQWNSYFSAVLYMNSRSGWPLQLVLREIIIESNTKEVEREVLNVAPFTLKMAAIVVTTLPIMCLYPFLQKYFMSGLTVGGVKG